MRSRSVTCELLLQVGVAGLGGTASNRIETDKRQRVKDLLKLGARMERLDQSA